MHVLGAILAFFGWGAHPTPHPPPPPPTYLVRETTVEDEKAVFATVEPTNVVPARARIPGTLLTLNVKWGDRVEQGQVIAVVGDRKLALQIDSYGAQVKAANDQVALAKVEYERAQRLFAAGAFSRTTFDQSRTAYNVALSNLKSIDAQRAVIAQQKSDGAVLAPTAGRVITTPVTAGTVVMTGDVVATVAAQNFVLRLEVPERHARYLKTGESVRLDGADLGLDGPRFGTIDLIYPQVDNGRVVADAAVGGLGDYFVGERVRVWVAAGERRTIIVPSRLIITRYGIDYARLWTAAYGAMDVPVQRGELHPTRTAPDGLEILSGLDPGDRLLAP